MIWYSGSNTIWSKTIIIKRYCRREFARDNNKNYALSVQDSRRLKSWQKRRISMCKLPFLTVGFRRVRCAENRTYMVATNMNFPSSFWYIKRAYKRKSGVRWAANVFRKHRTGMGIYADFYRLPKIIRFLALTLIRHRHLSSDIRFALWHESYRRYKR